MFGEFVQLTLNRIFEKFGLHHSTRIEDTFLFRYINFRPIGSSFVRKKNILRTICLLFSKRSNIEYRPVIQFFTQKGFHATEISKELDSVYRDNAPSYHTVVKWVTEVKEPERAFEDSPRMDRPSIITTDENIVAVERIAVHDRQTSVRRLADELAIPTTTVYEIMSNHLGMKKISTRWVLKLLIPVQRSEIVVKS